MAVVRQARERRLAEEGQEDDWGYLDDPHHVEVDPSDHGMTAFDVRSPMEELAERDAGVLIVLLAAGDAVRRAVAEWAAEDALSAARIRDEPWVREMLDAARRRESEVMVSFSVALTDSVPSAGDLQGMRTAMEALRSSQGPDSLLAACGALRRDDPADGVMDRLRAAFPQFSAG